MQSNEVVVDCLRGRVPSWGRGRRGGSVWTGRWWWSLPGWTRTGCSSRSGRTCVVPGRSCAGRRRRRAAASTAASTWRRWGPDWWNRTSASVPPSRREAPPPCTWSTSAKLMYNDSRYRRRLVLTEFWLSCNRRPTWHKLLVNCCPNLHCQHVWLRAAIVQRPAVNWSLLTRDVEKSRQTFWPRPWASGFVTKLMMKTELHPAYAWFCCSGRQVCFSGGL